jgi:transposase
VVVPAVQARLEDLITTLSEQITALDAELAAAVAQNSAGAANVALLVTIPGIGLLTALGRVVATLNFSGCTRVEELVSYAGLAPRPRQSGTSLRGPSRIGHSGHGPLRQALYRATLSAGRHNPPIKAFYTRLREAGTPRKVARCAAARKLRHLAGAVVTKQQPFDAAHGATPQEPPIAA